MGLLSRILGLERRSADQFTYGGPVPDWITPRTRSGVAVNEVAAENLATVTACVSAIGSALGTLPPRIYTPTAEGRREAPGHPVARLIAEPSPGLTWPGWVEWTIAQALLSGNALSELVTTPLGQVIELRPIPWRCVAPMRLPSRRLAFDVSMPGEPRRRLLRDEVFFLTDRSDDGLVGRSRISRAAEAMGNAIALQQFSANAWRSQGTPSGVISLAGKVANQDQADRIRSNMESMYSGTSNAGRIMILENGSTWQSVSVSPEDAEVLASRRFSVEEVCRIFQVPPPIVQDYTHNTFTNSHQAALWFAQFSLAPWINKIEAEFARSVFVDDARLEIDMSGLTRGDFKTRWESYEIAIRNDILTVDEVREAEGYGPMAKGAAADA